MKKNKKRIIIIASAFALLMSGSAAAFLLRGKITKLISPNAYLLNSFANTVYELNKHRSNLSLPDSSTLKTEPYEFVLSLGLRNYNLSMLPPDLEYTAEVLKLLTFVSTSNTDLAERKISNDISVNLMGVSVINANLFFSDTVYALGVPLLADTPFYINPNGIADGWNNSPFLPELTGVYAPEDLELTALSNFIFSDSTIIRSLSPQMLDSFEESVSLLLESSKVIINNEKTIEGYTVVSATCDVDALNSTFNSAADLVGFYVEEPLSYALELLSEFDEITELVNNYIAPFSPFTSDVTINFYTDKNDIIREIRIDDIRIANNEPFDISVVFSNDNDGRFADNINLAFKFDGSEINLAIDYTGCTKESLNQTCVLNIKTPGGDGSITYNAVWLPSDNDYYKLSLDCDFAGTPFGFAVEGRLIAEETSITVRDASFTAHAADEFIELKAAWAVKKDGKTPVFDIAAARNAFDVNIIEWGFIGSRLNDFLYSFSL